MTEASMLKLIILSITAIAGLFGGISISFFWQPKKLLQRSRIMAVAIISSISMSAAFALGGLVAMRLRIDLSQTDIALGLGYLVGACSIGVITWLANLFSHYEQQDIVEVTQQISEVLHHMPKKSIISNHKNTRI